MIVRILSAGTSFKGLGAYLTHDPKAETKERVGWTHTHNLANDHVNSAVSEMVWTARDAELLKQEAGIRAGGRATEKCAKHISLNWSPEERPTQEHMIETANGFLKHMKWDEHQAIYVSHTDKNYSHVHLMVNMVHPETGLRLDDNFERRRAQQWALNYERENGRVYCEQRLLDAAQREAALTRPAWEAFREQQKEFERDEAARFLAPPEDFSVPASPYAAEWKTLKEFQQRQRQDFFAEGKTAFGDVRRSVYGEVRGDYRQAWSDYFAARDEGADPEQLAARKAQLIAEQKAALETRRDAACAELRSSRDGIYQELLAGQRDTRGELGQRQADGLDNAAFLQSLREDYDNRVVAEFREAAGEIGEPAQSREQAAREEDEVESAPGSASEGGVHVGAGIFGLAARLFENALAPRPSRPVRSGPSMDELIDMANEKARQQSEQRLREQYDERDRDDEREREYGE